MRVCLRAHCAVRPPVADLRAVTDFAGRNLPDGLFQLGHHHLVIHQESLPEVEEKTMKNEQDKLQSNCNPSYFTIITNKSTNQISNTMN